MKRKLNPTIDYICAPVVVARVAVLVGTWSATATVKSINKNNSSNLHMNMDNCIAIAKTALLSQLTC